MDSLDLPERASLHPLYVRYEDEFPVSRKLIYLNHAAVAPLSLRAANAMKEHSDDVALNGSLHYESWTAGQEGLRTVSAKLMGASPEEIAIVKNTSEGISIIAQGLDWQPGDRMIAFREEFPANCFPWLRLESRGVQITWLSIYDPIETVARELPGARLLAISFVNYLSGFRADLKALGTLCREYDCFFFVDAIQGLGVFPLDVNECHIDALAADGHKWLLGPEGNGILYVRRERQDSIEPVEFGWTNPASFGDYRSRDMTLRPNAARYECGTLNTVGCFGLRAAVELLLEAGIAKVAESVIALTDQIVEGVKGLGYEPMLIRTADTKSGIVSFRHPAIDSRFVVSTLKQHKVLAIPRLGWVRVSPHFYNSPQQIETMLGSLPRGK